MLLCTVRRDPGCSVLTQGFPVTPLTPGFALHGAPVGMDGPLTGTNLLINFVTSKEKLVVIF